MKQGNDTPPPDSRGGVTPAIPDHQLVRRIAAGSYGEVWLARSAHGEWRAVKLVFQADFKDARPYEREYSGLVKFEPVSREHEGLVDILHVGRNDGDFFYCVMELADAVAPPLPSLSPAPSGGEGGRRPGEEEASLKSGDGKHAPGQPPASLLDPQAYAPKTLASVIQPRGRLPVDEILRFSLPLAEALVFLHERGLVHRDIKPSNIIFVRGQPKLADVGLVARMDDTLSLVGTEGFIPPEGPGTAQGDIYALGKVIYEAATGKDRHEFPELPTRLDSGLPNEALLELNEIILKACARNPGDRYPTAAALLADLKTLAAGASLRGRRTRRRNAAWSWSTAGLLLVVIAAALVSVFIRKYWPADPRVKSSWTHTLAVREFKLPPNCNGARRLGDSEGQGDLAIFGCSANGDINVLGLDGSYALEGRLPRIGNAFECSIKALADTDRDGRDEIFAAWRESTNFYVGVFNQGLGEIRRFAETDKLVRDAKGKLRQSFFQCSAELPPAGQDPAQVWLTWTHELPSFPRYTVCFDLVEGRERWRVPTTADIHQWLLLDANGDGRKDVIYSTSSPGNGVVIPNGRDDVTSYIIALDRDGRELWTNAIAFAPAYCPIQLRQAAVDGTNQIFALASRGLAVVAALNGEVPGFARLGRLDRRGNLLASWQATNELYSLALAALSAGEPTQAFVTDSEGYLNVFDPRDFTLLRRHRVTRPSHDWVQLTLVGVEDLDDDGAREIVLYSQQFDHVSSEGIGKPGENMIVEHTYDNRLIILNNRFRELASFTATTQSSSRGVPTLAIVQRNHPLRKEVVIVAKDAMLLELRRQW